jgi:hypothetical protein
LTSQPAVINKRGSLDPVGSVNNVMRNLSSESGGRCVGRIVDRRGWNLSHLSDPLGSPLFGLEQLLHVIDWGAWFLAWVICSRAYSRTPGARPSSASGVELCQRWSPSIGHLFSCPSQGRDRAVVGGEPTSRRIIWGAVSLLHSSHERTLP